MAMRYHDGYTTIELYNSYRYAYEWYRVRIGSSHPEAVSLSVNYIKTRFRVLVKRRDVEELRYLVRRALKEVSEALTAGAWALIEIYMALSNLSKTHIADLVG